MIATNFLSQSLYLKITPSVASFFGTYRTKILEQDNTTNLIEIKNSKLGNVNFANISYGLDLSLVKYNKFIFGVSVFNSFSAIGVGAYYTPTSQYFEIPEGYSSHTDIYFSSLRASNLHNFGISLSYNFKPKILFKLGVNYQIHKSNISAGNSECVYMTDGLFCYVSKNNQSVMNKKSFALQFEMEKAFLTKKNKNILSVKLSYMQGFRIMGGSTTVYLQEPLNYHMTIESTSRASGFSIGLSKPITLYEKK